MILNNKENEIIFYKKTNDHENLHQSSRWWQRDGMGAGGWQT